MKLKMQLLFSWLKNANPFYQLQRYLLPFKPKDTAKKYLFDGISLLITNHKG
jgi:hypothetical protein